MNSMNLISIGACMLDSIYLNWAAICDFQGGVLTSVDSDEPMQPPFKLRNSKLCSVSSLTVIEFLSDKQRLWSDCAYAQADLRLCWLHILHCWKSHVMAHISFKFCNHIFGVKTHVFGMKTSVHVVYFAKDTWRYECHFITLPKSVNH